MSRFWFASLLLSTLLWSCGSDEDASGDGGDTGSTGSTGSNDGQGKSARTPRPTGPLGPAQTMEVLAQGLADFDSTAVWTMLPASYQKDVNDIVHEFGAKMDAELWSGAMGTVGKVRDLLRDKDAYIMQHPLVAMMASGQGAKPESMKEGFDNLVTILDSMLSSDLATTDGLEKMDVGNFMAGPLNDILKMSKQIAEDQPQSLDALKAQVPGIDSLMSLDVSLVSEDGDSAVIQMPDPENKGQTVNQAMTKVEGKWIPADLAESWSTEVAKMREELAAMEISEEDKAQAMGMMQMVGGALDQLNAAESPSAFNIAINGLMEQFGPMMDGLGGGLPGMGGEMPGPGMPIEDGVMPIEDGN